MYGNECMSYSNVRKWVLGFNNGETSIADCPRLGRPSTAVSPENIARADQLIRDDRRMKVPEVAVVVEIGIDAADCIIHEELDSCMVCARWVPRQLTKDLTEEARRKAICPLVITTIPCINCDLLR